MRKLDLLAASALAVLMTSPSFAQETATVPQADDDMGDIIVTAQGRAQVAQDVPLAVAVVDTKLIQDAGISDVRGLRQLTPSLQTTTGQSTATGVVLAIRGIGTAGDNPGFEPAVGVFIDGVLRARAGLALSGLPELERVEVLRGPQGTLFGRNTSAGALNIITAKPKFEFGGYVEASYGNYNEIELKGGINAPLSEQFAVRLDGGYHKRDGFARDVNADRRFNNLDRYFVRGQALFENEALSIRLIGDFSKTDEQCCVGIHKSAGVTGAAVDFLAGLAGNEGIILPTNPKDRRVAYSPNRDLSERLKEWGVSAQIDYDFGDFNLTSITAYRNWRALRNQDIDFSGLDRAYREGYRTSMKDFTQEVRLQGTLFDGALDFLVGGFYLNETNKLRDTVRFGTQASQYVDALVSGNTVGFSPLAPNGFSLHGSLPGRPFLGQLLVGLNPTLPNGLTLQQLLDLQPALAPQFGAGAFLPTAAGGGQYDDNWRVKTKAFGIFTHNIINFNDQLSLTLGLRYNHEKKDIDADLNVVNGPCSALLPGGSSSLFGSILAGSPLATFALLTCNPTVNPEFNGVYSDGRSENEFTGTARLAYRINSNVLVFGGYSHGYKSGGYNLDRGGFDSRLFGGNGAQLTDLEFGKETVDSYEAGIKTNFSRAFQFNLTGFYQRFKGYQSLRFEGASFVVRQFDKLISKGIEAESIIRPSRDLTVNLAYTYLHAVVDDPINAGVDHDRQATNQPRHVVTAALTWTPRISDTVGGLVHVDARFNSDSNTSNDPLSVPFTTNDGHAIVNARVGLDFMDGRYGIEAYVENVFNKFYNITSFPVPEQTGAYAIYPAPPRFYGVKLRARF